MLVGLTILHTYSMILKFMLAAELLAGSNGCWLKLRAACNQLVQQPYYLLLSAAIIEAIILDVMSTIGHAF